MQQDQRILLPISLSLKDKLSEKAKLLNLSLSSYIRMILSQHLNS